MLLFWKLICGLSGTKFFDPVTTTIEAGFV